MYKIAIITAQIGAPNNPELIITSECQKELDAYGVVVYRFNDKDVNLLKKYMQPQFTKKEIYKETFYLKFRYWFRLFFQDHQKRFPKRKNNKSRLIAKIPRMLFYKLIPEDYDYFIWIDSKFTLLEGWLSYILDIIERNNDKDIMSYSHSKRKSITEEFDYMKYEMQKNEVKTLLARYNLSKMDNQVYYYMKNNQFVDNSLFETGVMIYSKNILENKEFLESWYAHNYYFTIQDQLSFPYIIATSKISVGVIDQSIYNTGYTRYRYH